MLTHIKGAHIVDPANGHDEIGDLWIHDDAIVAPPPGAKADETVDASGLIAMAGGIDIHSHIAGANVNTARLLLPEQHRAYARRPAETPLSQVGWTTFETGRLYAEWPAGSATLMLLANLSDAPKPAPVPLQWGEPIWNDAPPATLPPWTVYAAVAG